jgi:hypothetical protein
VAEKVTSLTEEEQVSLVVRRLDACKKHHDYFVRRFERLERSYRGLVNPQGKLAKQGWRNTITPPYSFQLIETVVANTIEEGLRLSARPAPRPNDDMEEIMASLDHAEACEDLIRSEWRTDEMDDKQRPLFLSDAICGMGIGTERWAYSRGPVQKQVVVEEDVIDPITEEKIGTVPTLKMTEVDEVKRDHSTFEVIDPRDFMIHESAKTLQPWKPGGAQYVLHRCWYSMAQLYEYERGGYMKNVEKLMESRDQSDEYSDRERSLFNTSRTKDLIEVIEQYEYAGGRILRTIVGNRAVNLSPTQISPFTHGEYPFIITNSIPQLFTLQGMSTVELIEKLQEMLWTLQSQRLDNIELINNAILLIRADIDDPEAFQWYPGAKWPVASPQDVQQFVPPYQLAGLTLEAEGMLKGDLQNVTSAAPLAGGVSSNIDQSTATGVSIVMNNAQKAMQARKYQAMKGIVQEANMRLKNCKQFMGDKRLVYILGENGVPLFKEIDPMNIQGEFAFEWTAASDSMMRQERRAEANQWLQVVSQMAPLLAASQTPLDLKQLVLWAAKKWDITDAEQFFSAAPAPQVAAQGGGSGGGGPTPPGAPAAPGEPNLGVTSSTAVDASSPSATGGMSMAPSVFAQRAMAMGGGAANA